MATVVVGSKLPHSIWLELVTPGEGRLPTAVEPDAPRVELKGANSLRISATDPSAASYRYATTTVDEALWREWLKRNAKLSFVRNGMVFEAKSVSEAQSKGNERAASLRTGLEPLAQNDDPRLKSAPGAPAHQRVEADSDHIAKLSGVVG